MKNHIKAILPLLGALFMLVEPYLIGKQEFTSHDWINVANMAVGLVVAFVAANTNGTIGEYAKEIGVGLAAALVALNNVVDGGITSQEFWQIVVAAGIALGVFVAPSPPKAVLPGAHAMGDSLQ